MIKLYNTLSRQLEELKPLRPPEVSLYACGPTVYNFAHIGNFRSFTFVDLLRRSLKFFGYSVKHAMNFTDVDDKTIRGANQAGESLRDFTGRYIEEFRKDFDSLNIEKQELQIRATDHIPQMIDLISKLVEKGHAYASEDGSVYYQVGSFPCYGCLAHLDQSGLQHGARVSQDEYQKESFGDFALWKAWAPEDGPVKWDSPWGPGRPGWHIECSAMSMHYLGEQFDIHTGGVDLVFPHHENEIAQSEAASGKRFVQIWAHCEHLLVNGQKMSKSAGNFFTLRDLLAKGYTGREIRYALVASTHYRQTLNFTDEGLQAAKASLGRIDEWVARARKQPVAAWDHEPFLKKFSDSLAEDLNLPEAMGHWFEFIRVTNKRMDEGLPVGDLAVLWARVDSVLGLGERREEIPAEIQALLDERAAARKAKDFTASDRLRDLLAAQGWLVKDTPKGQELRRK